MNEEKCTEHRVKIEQMEKEIKKHDRQLDGNGQPGVVRNMERQIAKSNIIIALLLGNSAAVITLFVKSILRG